MTLAKFEGKKVEGVGAEIRNAAGGLNDALKIEPVEHHMGEEVIVVLRCRLDKIRYEPIKDTEFLRRVEIFSASDTTIMTDDGVIAEALDDQKRRIEEALGVTRLPIELIAAHEDGDHQDEPVEACPMCAEETAARTKREK